MKTLSATVAVSIFVCISSVGCGTIKCVEGIDLFVSKCLYFGTMAIALLVALYCTLIAKSSHRSVRAAELAAEDASALARKAKGVRKKSTLPKNEPPDPIDHRRIALYQVAAEHYISSNDILWSYLHYFFVGCSVLALAWVSVFVVEKPQSQHEFDVVLAALSVAGITLSVLWTILLRRAFTYRRPLFDVALKTEEAVAIGTDTKNSFQAALRHREVLGEGLGTTLSVVTAVPLLFLLLFVIFFFLHFCARVCG